MKEAIFSMECKQMPSFGWIKTRKHNTHRGRWRWEHQQCLVVKLFSSGVDNFIYFVGSQEIAQLVECLSQMHETLDSILSTEQTGHGEES